MLAQSLLWRTQLNLPTSHLQNIQHIQESFQCADNHRPSAIRMLSLQRSSQFVARCHGCWAIELLLGAPLFQSGNTFCNLRAPSNHIHKPKFLEHHPYISTILRNRRNGATKASAQVVVSGTDHNIFNHILISQVTHCVTLPSIVIGSNNYCR